GILVGLDALERDRDVASVVVVGRAHLELGDRLDGLRRRARRGRGDEDEEREQHRSRAHRSITSTLARGTRMTSPPPRSTSRTRTLVSDGIVASSTGSAATLPMRPKYGARMQRTGAP